MNSTKFLLSWSVHYNFLSSFHPHPSSPSSGLTETYHQICILDKMTKLLKVPFLGVPLK